MSLFVGSNCKIVGDTAVNQVSWCKVDQIAALSAYTIDENDHEINRVFFANNEGELFPGLELTHDCEALLMEWHPHERIIAIGWGDGMISTWSVDVKNVKAISQTSNTTQHQHGITCMKWNPSGKRLVTGDKKGVVCVWSADNKGNLTVLRQYRKKGEITALVFCLIHSMASLESQLNSAAGAGGHSKGGGIKLVGNDAKNLSYSPSFFYGTNKGSIVYADDAGHCTEVQQLTSEIDVLLFFEERSRLIVISRSLLLTQYHVSEDGKVSRVMQVKLSISGEIVEKGLKYVYWAGPGIIAMASEEKMIRFLDLVGDESYNISLTASMGGFVDRTDRVSVLAFNPTDRYLAIGTALGIVAVFKYVGPQRDLHHASTMVASQSHHLATSSADWELVFRVSLTTQILHLSWLHGITTCLAAVSEDGLTMLNESIIQSNVCGDLSVIQESAHEVSVHYLDFPEARIIQTGIPIRGLSLGRSCFVIWSGKVAKVYRINPQHHRFEPLDPVKTSGVAMVIADASHIVDEAWFIAEGSIVKVVNFKGTQKATINFSDTEGSPLCLDIRDKFLAIVTNKGCIKVIDVHTPTKPKQLGSSGQFNVTNLVSDGAETSRRIRMIRVNSSGTMIAILCSIVEGTQHLNYPDSKIYVYDRNKGALLSYDYCSNRRHPTNILWDESDDRLLACETSVSKSATVSSSNDDSRTRSTASSLSRKKVNDLDEDNGGERTKLTSDNDSFMGPEVYLMFVTSEQGILMQDSMPSEPIVGALMGLNAPHIFYRKATKHGSSINDEDYKSGLYIEIDGTNVLSRILRDFVGMKNVTESIKSSLLDFSFYLTLGKLDEAYRVVKEINSPAIWENMAQMCVKTKRLDVAEVCLGNMGHARGAAAVREAKKEGNLDVAIGVLAIQLGLNEEAAALFREAKRYDMLNNLYQASGRWEKAISIAETKDRIHLKSTHYNYAKYLESIGKIDEAIDHFQFSDNARHEVPRMLFGLGRLDDLGEYVLQTEDQSMLKWWASYLESIGRIDKSKKYYSKAKDYLSMVRIYCFQGDLQAAAEVISETNDRASAYHFARQLELQGEFQEAINFFALSGCYNHSIRLAREHGLDAELMRYALKSTQSLMVESAQHYEGKGEFDKAMQLYHRGGDTSRALELCFRIGEEKNNPHTNMAFEMLNTIAQELGADSSPQILARCGDFLVQHKQYEKAIDLYVMAKRYMAAIDMCLQNRVFLSDSMVEKLSPLESMDPTERKDILKDLAKVLKKQGSFTQASKKYTQAGDRVRAIKCLVRSGDTKAVIQFATISRNPEIFTLAANYLQQMNWRGSLEIMKAIISFYTKAKSFMQLAGFYDSCAQVEIDEYKDYEKAAGALGEALKYLGKDNSPTAADMRDVTERRLLLITKFAEAKAVSRQDPMKMIAICEALLQDPNVEEAIRVGDCLSLLIDHYYKVRNMQDAYQYLRELQQRNIPLDAYIDNQIVQDILNAVGVKNERPQAKDEDNRRSSVDNSRLGINEEEEDIEDEIGEELEEDARHTLSTQPRNFAHRK